MLVSVQNILKVMSLMGFIVFFLSACATLNKDECRTANWKLIGLEDGSKGYPVSRIGEHRKACAEYGISPNLEQYKLGRIEGLRKYCVPANGFNLGRKGIAYSGTCAGVNEPGYLEAYNHGKEVRDAEVDLKNKQALLAQKKSELDHNVATISQKEQLIISGKVSGGRVVLLIVEVQDLGKKQVVLLNQIQQLELDIHEQSEHFSSLQQQYRY